jgi:hypothetical protein
MLKNSDGLLKLLLDKIAGELSFRVHTPVFAAGNCYRQSSGFREPSSVSNSLHGQR